jgi:hypothetical protein
MGKLLTIGQVAKRLRRSVDYVRRLDDEGILKSEPRRKDEHRRYREEVVTGYLAKQQGQHRRTLARVLSKPARRQPAPRVGLPEPHHFLEEDELPDEWIDPSPPAPPTPRQPSLAETVHLDILHLSGMNDGPWALPVEWRAKLNADLKKYITLERFPLNGNPLVTSLQISKHVRDFLEPYREEQAVAAERQRKEQAAEADRQRQLKQAADAAERRRQELIDYGRQVAQRETASWAWDDPTAEARGDVEQVLRAEVKADWEESTVRELVENRLDRYEEEDAPDEDGEIADEEDDEEEI